MILDFPSILALQAVSFSAQLLLADFLVSWEFCIRLPDRCLLDGFFNALSLNTLSNNNWWILVHYDAAFNLIITIIISNPQIWVVHWSFLLNFLLDADFSFRGFGKSLTTSLGRIANYACSLVVIKRLLDRDGIRDSVTQGLALLTNLLCWSLKVLHAFVLPLLVFFFLTGVPEILCGLIDGRFFRHDSDLIIVPEVASTFIAFVVLRCDLWLLLLEWRVSMVFPKVILGFLGRRRRGWRIDLLSTRYDLIRLEALEVWSLLYGAELDSLTLGWSVLMRQLITRLFVLLDRLEYLN